jgi:hypothetical protein
MLARFLFIIALCLIPGVVGATATSPTYCGTGANYNDGGAIAWSDPTNIQGDTTSTAATCAPASRYDYSQMLRASNFGFAVDSSAVIDGVVVEQERAGSSNNRFYDTNVQMLVAGAEAGTNLSGGATYSNSKGFVTFGSSTNLWGNILTPAIVNASGFGVSFKGQRTTSTTVTASVYRVRITVYYHLLQTYSTSMSAGALVGGSDIPKRRMAISMLAGSLDGGSMVPTLNHSYVVSTSSGALVGGSFSETTRGNLSMSSGAISGGSFGKTARENLAMLTGTVTGGSFTELAGRVLSMSTGSITGGTFGFEGNNVSGNNYTTSMSGGMIALNNFGVTTKRYKTVGGNWKYACHKCKPNGNRKCNKHICCCDE